MSRGGPPPSGCHAHVAVVAHASRGVEADEFDAPILAHLDDDAAACAVHGHDGTRAPCPDRGDEAALLQRELNRLHAHWIGRPTRMLKGARPDMAVRPGRDAGAWGAADRRARCAI